MLQRVPTALAQVKADKTSDNLNSINMNSIKLYILCFEKVKLPKKYIRI